MVTQRLDIYSGKRRRSQEKVSILLESSNHFLYLRESQRHSGDNAIDPQLQNNVLLPEGFAEYIYHVGNVSEVHSLIRSGLIPGGTSLKRGRHAVFFTTVNPMEDDNGMEETPCDLTKPSIAPYSLHTKILGNLFKILYMGAI